MGILSNFIGAAAGAGGEIMQRQREADVDLAKQKSYADYASELDLKKQETIMALQQGYKVGDEARADARAVASEDRGMKNRATERQTIVDETVANAPRLREVKVADTKAAEMAKYDPEIQALMRKAETEKLTATEQAKLDHFTKNRTSILGQIRDTARAGDIDHGAGLRAIQIQTEQLKLDLAKTEAKIPPAVKLLAAPISKEIDTISAALAKAQAEGMFDPNSESGKALLMRQADANKRLGDLVNPYLGDKAPPKEPAPKAPQEIAPGYVSKGYKFTGGDPSDKKNWVAETAGKAAAEPAAKPKAAAQFNEAGYADVQGTIDGAKRGDAKALELLRKMIARGETNPGQRDQIAKLLNK